MTGVKRFGQVQRGEVPVQHQDEQHEDQHAGIGTGFAKGVADRPAGLGDDDRLAARSGRDPLNGRQPKDQSVQDQHGGKNNAGLKSTARTIVAVELNIQSE